MTHIARETAFDKERNARMRREIRQKISDGFTNLKTVPTHCVSANYGMSLCKFGYTPRVIRRINPYRLGFSNDYVGTHFNFPYECIFVTEAQKYLNSRMSMYFPDWQSRWYEQHGHNDLDIWLDTQRPMLIDVNIRELARFIEIKDLDISYTLGRVTGLKWVIRIIDNSALFDRYMSSGKTDKACYTEETVTAEYNVFGSYDSRCCKPRFYDGHFNEDYDYSPAAPTEQTVEGYMKYLLENDDELPEGYFVRRGKTLC